MATGASVPGAFRTSGRTPAWFPYFDLACAGAAGALWYLWPQLGAWPLLIGLAPWAIRWLRIGYPSQRTPFDIPLLIFLLTAAFGVWSAFDRPEAMEKFWQIVGGILIYYALANWSLGRDRLALIDQAWLLAVLGAGLAGYFFLTNLWSASPAKIAAVQAAGVWIETHVPRLPGHQLNPNVAGGMMAVLIPFAAAVFALSIRGRKGGATALAASLLGLALLGLLFTSSRGAWLGLGIAAAAAVWWQVCRRLTRDSPGRCMLLFAALPGVLLLAAFMLVALRPALALQALNTFSNTHAGIRRGDLIRDSLILVNDYLLLGGGLKSFIMLFPTYAILMHVGVVAHTHNLFLDVLIEQGLIALLALAWCWLLVAEAFWRAGRGVSTRRPRPDGGIPAAAGASLAPTGSRRTILGAAGLSLLVLLAHGLVDDTLYGSRAVLLLFIPLAFANRFLPRQAPAERLGVRLAIPAVTLVLLALLAWRPLLSVVHTNLAAIRQSQVELGLYRFPEFPVQDEVRRAADLQAVMAGYGRALELNPANASANRRLGQLELSLGHYGAALRHLEAAYAALPADRATAQLLGEAYILSGQEQRGLALWRQLPNDFNQLLLRPAWYQSIGDVQHSLVLDGLVNQLLGRRGG
ncbi:MAG: O-antigen ligase family protein [Candidatus Promineifilaceae bacterium]